MHRFGPYVCALVLFVLGCSESGDGGGVTPTTTYQGRAESVKDTDRRTPFDVLHAAVMTANTGDFAGAEQYILPNSAMGTNEMGKNLMPEKWPPFTHDGTVARIEFVDEEYMGHEVHVGYRMTYNDGSTFEDRATIERVDDRWKIAFMTHANMF